jgi:hypothetical protein
VNESIFSLFCDHLASISDGSASSPPLARIIRDFWCLFGVYYKRALERGEGIRETKEKSSKPTPNNDLRASPLET